MQEGKVHKICEWLGDVRKKNKVLTANLLAQINIFLKEINGSFVSELDQAYRYLQSLRP